MILKIDIFMWQFHFIAKNIERVGDYVTSIAEQAIYVATGEYPSEERPKVDTTSLTKIDPESVS